MGLLDGVQSLQGAPAPSAQSQAHVNANGANGGDVMSQFSHGAKSLFGDFGSSVGVSMSSGVENIGDGVKSGVNSLRRMMGDESVQDDLEAAPVQMSLSEEMGAMFNLTMMQRIALFSMCFGTGVLMIFISFSFLPVIVLVPHKFAAAFTMGNVLCIVSTWVLAGPRSQLQTMFHPVRAVAAIIYVASLVCTLLAAFFGGKLRYIIVIASLVAEIGACK